MRTFVFIDGYNFSHLLEKRKLLHYTWCNFVALAELLKKDNDEIKRVLYFTTEVNTKFMEEDRGEMMAQRFWLAAVKTVIPESDIFYGKFLKPNNHRIEKMTDTHITMQLLLTMKDYDKAIVISGDLDFWPVYRYLKENGKTVCVFSPAFDRGTKYHEPYILEEYCLKRGIDFQFLKESLLRKARFDDIVRDKDGVAVAECGAKMRVKKKE